MCPAVQTNYEMHQPEQKQLEFHDEPFLHVKSRYGMKVILPPPPMASIEIPLDNPTHEFYIVNDPNNLGQVVVESTNMVTSRAYIIDRGKTAHFRYFKAEGWVGGVFG